MNEGKTWPYLTNIANKDDINCKEFPPGVFVPISKSTVDIQKEYIKWSCAMGDIWYGILR